MEILIGRHDIHITCFKVTCNPTKFECFSKVYYHISFENYVVYEAVILVTSTSERLSCRLLRRNIHTDCRGNRLVGSQVESNNIIHFVTL
jgi:hypothetical protein